MLETKIFNKILVSNLIKEDMRWRERRVQTIVPITQDSYRTSISLQVRIPRDIIEKSRDKAVMALEIAEDLARHDKEKKKALIRGIVSRGLDLASPSPIRCILPLFTLPKQLLMEFTIKNQSGEPLNLLARMEQGYYTSMFLTDLMTGSGQLEDIGELTSFQRIIRALVYCHPPNINQSYGRIIQDSMEKDGAFQYDYQSLELTMGWVEARLNEHFDGFTFSPRIRKMLETLCLEQINPFMQAYYREGYPYRDDKCLNPAQNPIAVLFYYVRYRDLASGGALSQLVGSKRLNPTVLAYIKEFIRDCDIYLSTMMKVVGSDIDGVLLEEIAKFTYQRLVYSSIDLFVNRSMTFKLEHVLPLGDYPEKSLDSFRNRDRFSHDKAGSPRGENRELNEYRNATYTITGSQGYPIAIGDARSTHIEIKSPDAANIEIRDDTFVEIGRERFDPQIVFGDTTAQSYCVQHFYTTKDKSVVRRLKEKSGITDKAEESMVFLRVRYAPAKYVQWIYFFSIAISILSLAMLITLMVLHFCKHTSPSSSLPLGIGAVSLVIAIVSTRETHPLVVDLLRTKRITLIVLNSLVWLLALILVFFMSIGSSDNIDKSKQTNREPVRHETIPAQPESQLHPENSQQCPTRPPYAWQVPRCLPAHDCTAPLRYSPGTDQTGSDGNEVP